MNTITANFLQAGDKVQMFHGGPVRTVEVAKVHPKREGKMAVRFADTTPGKVEILDFARTLFRP